MKPPKKLYILMTQHLAPFSDIGAYTSKKDAMADMDKESFDVLWEYRPVKMTWAAPMAKDYLAARRRS